MRTIYLKCESDLSSYDQTVREIIVEREDEANWYGKPLVNPDCPTLQWPKFAWKRLNTTEVRKRPTLPTLSLTGEEFNAQIIFSHKPTERRSTFRTWRNVHHTPAAQEALDLAGETAIHFYAGTCQLTGG